MSENKNMDLSPIIAANTPFGGMKAVLNPNFIISYGFDSQGNAFADTYDGNRYFVMGDSAKALANIHRSIYGKDEYNLAEKLSKEDF